MERLTIEYCGEYVPKELCSIDRLGGADDCDLCCEYCKATEEGSEDCRGCAINQCFNKLGEYEDLEEQGKLLKLPCEAGDTVWKIKNGKIQKWVVGTIKIEEDGVSFCNVVYICDISDFGETVFLTREEAEAALKELESEEE